MPINTPTSDYELEEHRTVTDAAALRALANPLRGKVLELVLERAATVTELAEAIGRPKGTVAHHVATLVHAGLLRVVRTRRVRAMDERYYGRVAWTTRSTASSTPRKPPRPSFSATEPVRRSTSTSPPTEPWAGSGRACWKRFTWPGPPTARRTGTRSWSREPTTRSPHSTRGPAWTWSAKASSGRAGWCCTTGTRPA
ncbi:ArsR family transcriptional regulator [Cryobacterium cheniae]|uniref:ArsR family transcriptional regulator n=1 Tax=Cryobacterium cheniae TaxID=1259262 RepID=A0A4R8XWU6_9MICO|nr:ArsR family transcriptional regulator [Cryobacterium cheniae]